MKGARLSSRGQLGAGQELTGAQEADGRAGSKLFTMLHGQAAMTPSLLLYWLPAVG